MSRPQDPLEAEEVAPLQPKVAHGRGGAGGPYEINGRFAANAAARRHVDVPAELRGIKRGSCPEGHVDHVGLGLVGNTGTVGNVSDRVRSVNDAFGEEETGGQLALVDKDGRVQGFVVL